MIVFIPTPRTKWFGHRAGKWGRVYGDKMRWNIKICGCKGLRCKRCEAYRVAAFWARVVS